MKTGRPKSENDRKISVKIPLDLYSKLYFKAKSRNVSISEVIRECLEKYAS